MNDEKLRALQEEVHCREAHKDKSKSEEKKIAAATNKNASKLALLESLQDEGDALDKFYLKTHLDNATDDTEELLGHKHVTHEIVHRYNTHGAGTAKKFALPELVRERTKDVRKELAAFG